MVEKIFKAGGTTTETNARLKEIIGLLNSLLKQQSPTSFTTRRSKPTVVDFTATNNELVAIKNNTAQVGGVSTTQTLITAGGTNIADTLDDGTNTVISALVIGGTTVAGALVSGGTSVASALVSGGATVIGSVVSGGVSVAAAAVSTRNNTANLDAKLDHLSDNSDHLSGDLDAILNKLLTAPATEAKQDTLQTAVNLVRDRLISGPNSAATILDAIADDSLGHKGAVTANLSISDGDSDIDFRPSINESEQTIGLIRLQNTAIGARTWNWIRTDGTTEVAAVLETPQIVIAGSSTEERLINLRVQRDNYLILRRTNVIGADIVNVSWQGERGSGQLDVTSTT